MKNTEIQEQVYRRMKMMYHMRNYHNPSDFDDCKSIQKIEHAKDLETMFSYAIHTLDNKKPIKIGKLFPHFKVSLALLR
ncbi:MAG: hypothetical protein ACK5KR_00570 [Breznakia sp.]